jgi:DNA invertase Pin-like site-specific DNA recombinase
LSFQRWLSIS